MTRQQPAILRPSKISARDRGGGVRSIQLVTRHTGSTSFMNGITLFAPGAAIPLHFHNCEESVCLIEGRAIFELDGITQSIESGDVTFIPAGMPHRFVNASQVAGMKIFWTYASIDADRTIVATGENSKIDFE